MKPGNSEQPAGSGGNPSQPGGSGGNPRQPGGAGGNPKKSGGNPSHAGQKEVDVKPPGDGGYQPSSDSVKMEDLMKIINPMRRHFSRNHDEAMEELAKKDFSFTAFEPKFREFLSTSEELWNWHSQLRVTIGNAGLSPAEEDFEYSEMSRFFIMSEQIKVKVDAAVRERQEKTVSVAGASTCDESASMGVKLTDMEIAKFDGDLKDWLRFWAQFQRIHANPKLAGSVKFWYLLQYLKEGSEPHEMFAQTPQTEKHYEDAIATLQKRYGNNNLLVQVYLNELLKLTNPHPDEKEKMPFEKLFLKVDSNYRSLKSLQLEKVDPNTWLYPMIEKCLPKDLLYKWKSSRVTTEGQGDESQLDALFQFMENEREIRRQMDVTLGKDTHGHPKDTPAVDKTSNKTRKDNYTTKQARPKQTMGFHVKSKPVPCVFCDELGHRPQHCPTAMESLSQDERMKRLRKGGLCFICVLPHRANVCRNKAIIRCDICGGPHHKFLCKQEPLIAQNPKRMRMDDAPGPSSVSTMTAQVSHGEVCLQTIKLILENGGKHRVVRALLDTASMRSYVTKETAMFLKLTPLTEERLIHSVFGTRQGTLKHHNVYGLNLRSVVNNNASEIVVRDEHTICKDIQRAEILTDRFLSQLGTEGIQLSDIPVPGPLKVDLLIGADCYGRFLTGRIKTLSNGMTAIETVFGWTLLGEYNTKTEGYMNVTAMLSHDKLITNLWELDLIGIQDPTEILTLQEKEYAVKNEFLAKIQRDSEGRYIVKLPWKDLHPALANNREIAVQRLVSTTKKLKAASMFTTYDSLFKSWEQEGFIEETTGSGRNLHYCPHRAVIKLESLTTPVRPVFDASCRVKGGVSLNECLHKGPSYITLIPEVILRFREKFVGFVSDIRKAFQMIEIHLEDRDALRFLWWKGKDMSELMEYRHKRVPFGANCSPFILGAVLERHLKSVEGDMKEVADRLWETLYVDNCCSSEPNVESYQLFKEQSIDILADAKMELRMWLSNIEDLQDPQTKTVSVLGLKWDRPSDELFVDTAEIVVPTLTTKRTVLSTVSKIYDPVGLTAPATLAMKLLLQQLWTQKLKWDEELADDDKRQFTEWSEELHDLSQIRVPRNLDGGVTDHNLWEMHVMADGSKRAYGAVCYLRVHCGNSFRVSLLAAKAKVAPLKHMTIPRLELLGCLIAARLASTIKKTLKMEDVSTFYWSDSTTALSWIKRIKEWSTFVGRRVTEINKITDRLDWFHLPGELNPADLPSRGCKPKFLLDSKWVEGPWWLKLPRDEWPHAKQEEPDEEQISSEERKTPIIGRTVTAINLMVKDGWSFMKTVRVQSYVRRFIFNMKNPDRRKSEQELSLTEQDLGEIDVIRQIQAEVYGSDCLTEIKGFETFVDEAGVLRLKTKLRYSDDSQNFKFPAILPGKHPLVQNLIFATHRAFCHAGVEFLLVKLRKKYWIPKGRQSIRKVTSRCHRCRRYSATRTVTPIAPLPRDRVKDADCFESVGIDLAGPFITKNGKKTWVVIYTCAVYRAVILRLIPSLSTRAFIVSLAKFIEDYRRPCTIYSDNGTNFRGTDNLFRAIDWNQVMKEEGVSKITWKFNPASAPWWGGWWERLIRTMKDLLRKTVGKALLTATELSNILKKVEEVMNDRPLTYVSEDPEDLEPLTPSMFLRPLGGIKFPEKELVDGDELRYRYRYMKSVMADLRVRFRKEYLGMMISRNPAKATRPLSVGELVFVGCDNKKRVSWPLGRITKLFNGKDGIARVAEVKTADGVITRDVKRLYALEADASDPVNAPGEMVTRSGRRIIRTERA